MIAFSTKTNFEKWLNGEHQTCPNCNRSEPDVSFNQAEFSLECDDCSGNKLPVNCSE